MRIQTEICEECHDYHSKGRNLSAMVTVAEIAKTPFQKCFKCMRHQGAMKFYTVEMDYQKPKHEYLGASRMYRVIEL